MGRYWVRMLVVLLWVNLLLISPSPLVRVTKRITETGLSQVTTLISPLMCRQIGCWWDQRSTSVQEWISAGLGESALGPVRSGDPVG